MSRKETLVGLLVMFLVAAGVVLPARADDSAGDGGWMDVPKDQAAAEQEYQKNTPLSFSVDYMLVSDYIWRGQNFSEAPGEGREMPNHQLSLGVEADLGKFGAIGYGAWFEWWAGEMDFNGNSDHLQEVDHNIYWSYDLSTLCEDIPVSVELGWIAYIFPGATAGSDGYYTNEFYLSLAIDDSKLFGTDGGVLNPSISWYWDVDDAQGHWFELGISHDFALADLGMSEVAVVKDITVTPSLVFGIDHNFYDTDGKSTRAATLVYGLDVAYDLSTSLGIPPEWGSLTVTGTMAYSQALNDKLRETLMDDEFYGGIAVGWSW